MFSFCVPATRPSGQQTRRAFPKVQFRDGSRLTTQSARTLLVTSCTQERERPAVIDVRMQSRDSDPELNSCEVRQIGVEYVALEDQTGKLALPDDRNQPGDLEFLQMMR